MRETLELRIDFDRADGLFGADEGKALGFRSTRKVVLASDDPRLATIQARQLALRQEGTTLYTGWTYHRHYTKAELREASMLTLSVGWSSELSGDRAGTVYTTANACPVCGSGVEKLSPLRLHLGKVPRVKDIVRGHTGEFVVSSHFVEAYKDAGALGAVFVPVEFRRAPKGKAPAWFEMRSSAEPISMLGGTRFASGAFPDAERDAKYHCPLGDRLGYYRISEVRLTTVTPPAVDVVETREYLGGSPPSREMLISGRLYQALIAAGIRGLGVEIARLSDEAPP